MGRVWCSEHDQPSPEESNHMFCSLITRSSQLCLVCRSRPCLQNMNMNHDSAASSPISFLKSLFIHNTAYYQGHLGIVKSVIKLGVFSRRPVDVLSCFCGVKSGRFLQEICGPSPSVASTLWRFPNPNQVVGCGKRELEHWTKKNTKQTFMWLCRKGTSAIGMVAQG